MQLSLIQNKLYPPIDDLFSGHAAEKDAESVGKTNSQIFDRPDLKVAWQASEDRFRTTVEALRDGLVILSAVRNASGFIVDFRYEYVNEAGCRFYRKSREEMIGHTVKGLQPVPDELGLLAEYSKVVDTGQPLIKENIIFEDVLDGILPGRVFDLRVVKLGEGAVSIWRDVTEEKKVAESERELRILTEALQDIAIILNSSLDREIVLDHILAQLGRVVPYDSVNLMLIENDVARVVRCRGYEERGLQEAVFLHRLNVTETKNLKWMAETGKPMTFPDTWQSPDWIRLPTSEWIRSYAGAPLRVNGRTIGFLNVNSATQGLYNEKYAHRLQTFAVQSALAIENAQLFKEVQELAFTDVVTGLYNRRGMLELGQQEFVRSIRFSRPLSVLMIDIDYFKQTNDLLGHEGGDEVLRALAKLLRETLRRSDIVCRYGGEEFLVLLSETKISSAMVVSERLRKALEAAKIIVNGTAVQCTMSVGVAGWQGETSDLLELIKQADKALYKAKQSGRNRVVAFESKST